MEWWRPEQIQRRRWGTLPRVGESRLYPWPDGDDFFPDHEAGAKMTAAIKVAAKRAGAKITLEPSHGGLKVTRYA